MHTLITTRISFALCFGIASLLAAHAAIAEDAWLSTPESVAEFRQQVESMRPNPTKFALASVEDRTITLENREIRIRIYDPGSKAPKPVLIYVHGACWVAGSLDSHDEVSRYLASESNAIVVAIDYRLAPEHKFPDAHNDVYDTVQWIWDHAGELGIDKSRFAIAGESTGAYFAAATAIRAMDEPNSPKFSFLLLTYAALDGGGSSWSECKDQYFRDKDDVRSRYGSPLWAEDLSGMPKTFNIFGQYETSRAEEELFMRKLKDNGVAVNSFMNPAVGHDVQTWLTVSGNLAAHEAAIEFIQQGFASGSQTGLKEK
ncbi:alpha/beta hydrolase [Dokdonella sp.]|uniref:alpha/beta hydrolase n=1 Tax=Dokdonella sp. TaxID=2291710 RepID=UPI003C401913